MTGVSVSRAELKAALDFVKSMVPPLPMIKAYGTHTDGMLTVSYHAGVLTIIATDGIQGAKAEVPCTPLEGTDAFSIGCEPVRLLKVVTKDSADTITLSVDTKNVTIYDNDANGSPLNTDYSTLALADMRRANKVYTWVPSEPIAESTIPHDCTCKVLSFLDDFLPDGKDEGSMHAVVVLSNKVAHSTNGVNMRGICASPVFTFKKDICLRKRYLTTAIRAIKALKCESIEVKADRSVVSFRSDCGTKSIVIPMARKTAPALPAQYFMRGSNRLTLDPRKLTKALDKMVTSDYSTSTSLTGISLEFSADRIDMVLEENLSRASLESTSVDAFEATKVLDINTLLKISKVFQKDGEISVYVGDDDSRYIKFHSNTTIDNLPVAFMAVCSYSRYA